MVDKELIERYRKTVKPVVASWLLNINYEEMGEQDKEEFERDFDEILDLALIGLKYKTQLSREGTTSDLISRTETLEHFNRLLGATVPVSDYDEGFVDGVQFAIGTISTIPTIQPVATDTNVGDTISRQAAIDALAKQMPTPYTPDGSHPADEGIFQVQEVYADCIETLELLPSAQSEEAIPVAWISAQIERLKGMDNLFAGLTADIIQTTLNEWRKEQEGETT